MNITRITKSWVFVAIGGAIGAMANDSAVAAKPLAQLCAEFQNFDQNQDGSPEIRQLSRIDGVGGSGPLVVMLVEDRILEPLSGSRPLAPFLHRWAEDVATEGFSAEIVSVALGRSKVHQDGRYVLALRELLRAVRRERELSGVVLVGHFPDSQLVRKCNWFREGDVTLHHKEPEQKEYKGVLYLWHSPEVIAGRADIVLSDLDGRWEEVYVQPKTAITRLAAVFEGKPTELGGKVIDVETSPLHFEDYFGISDGSYEIVSAGQEEANGPTAAGQGGGGADSPRSLATIVLKPEAANYECGIADSRQPNISAQPDIMVSRLDAHGVAYRPDTELTGEGGARLLDREGKPQAIELASGSGKRRARGSQELWKADPKFERQLLAEYFDRNHAYRRGMAKLAWRPSSIACELRSGYRVMLAASGKWEENDLSRADVRGKPTLAQFVDWMQYPAVLRTVRAHSYPQGSQFQKADVGPLEAKLGGPAWAWVKKGNRLEPSLAKACGSGMLNWYLLHTLYENGQVAPEPCFYQHGGCDSITPPGAERAYNDPAYGRYQGAESLMLFGNGLALIGRSKVFYDDPAGFAETLRAGKTFGESWARYFQIEAERPLSDFGGGDIGRKRAYFWSVLGDWTLRFKSKVVEDAKTSGVSVDLDEK